MENGNFTQEQTDVLNAVLEMTRAFHKKDMERVLASYESSAVIVFAPEQPVSDLAGIRAGFAGFFTFDPKFDYSGHEVFVSGDLAVHVAPWTMTGTTPDGTPITQTGLSVAVLRRQPDGRWLMVIDNPFGARLLDK
ncbi:MAG: SnoaL-like domain-containing protein [Bacteroidia bacterium]|nr:SnoaL-like domain-containing protein [Bacteroidia bacterium]